MGKSANGYHVWCDVMPGGAWGVFFKYGTTDFCYARGRENLLWGSAYMKNYFSGIYDVNRKRFVVDIRLSPTMPKVYCEWIMYMYSSAALPIPAASGRVLTYPKSSIQGLFWPRREKWSSGATPCGRYYSATAPPG